MLIKKQYKSLYTGDFKLDPFSILFCLLLFILVLFMWTVIKMWASGNSGGAPWWSYWSAGITNTIGPAMGIEALKYISYPAQV